MATCGELLKKAPKKERFGLGRGDWGAIFSFQTNGPQPFKLSDILKNPEDLAKEIKTNVFENDSDYTDQECLRIAKKIFNWADDSELYYGTDVGDIYDENEKPFDTREFPITDDRYYNPKKDT
jgi:hypothetical protein